MDTLNPRPESFCEVRSQKHCQCVCVSCSPLLSLPCVNNPHCNTHILWSDCPSKNSEVKKFQHDLIALLLLSAMPSKLFQYCEQLSLYVPLLLRLKLHLLHAYYMLTRRMCMLQDTTVPDAFILKVMICIPHSFLGQKLKHITSFLILFSDLTQSQTC